MPTYSVGQRLRSAVSSVEAIVVRVPNGDVTITCAGEPMLGPDDKADPAAAPAHPAQRHTLLGKRYQDEASNLEMLCVAAGAGEIAVDGRTLTIKTAQPLPASD
ncbi:hypothetical protein [Cryptosporangium aurantiacum]|uniref:Uncharacterized protein n=1 Tax=Cryptosporangium aurantiacum TaxID=134849 RepID=A0A1M7KNS6_9ACTN|nr:hypothetical protein [Cryptosporangium aurantiacum]SHM67099.1 hypothetical protein SAMN05443668_1011206 [Cryptosporangium aurantiacum]